MLFVLPRRDGVILLKITETLSTRRETRRLKIKERAIEVILISPRRADLNSAISWPHD